MQERQHTACKEMEKIQTKRENAAKAAPPEGS